MKSETSTEAPSHPRSPSAGRHGVTGSGEEGTLLQLAKLRAENAELLSLCEKYRSELEAMRKARGALASEMHSLLERLPLKGSEGNAVALPVAAPAAIETSGVRLDGRALEFENLLRELEQLHALERLREQKALSRPWYKKLIKYPRKTLVAAMSRLRR